MSPDGAAGDRHAEGPVAGPPWTDAGPSSTVDEEEAHAISALPTVSTNRVGALGSGTWHQLPALRVQAQLAHGRGPPFRAGLTPASAGGGGSPPPRAGAAAPSAA